MSTNPDLPTVIVVGAGPAGLFAAQRLADSNVNVVILNRDIKPGGLAEYGIFLDKYKMKSGLRKQFGKILDHPNITYMGNVTLGDNGDISFEQLRNLNASAILVAVGAQGTKWLGTPGELSTGVFHAKDLVYHYNLLPPYAERYYPLGQRVAIVGAGNVMMDIANYCIRYLNVEEVVAIVRRDAGAVKFDRKEMSTLFNNLDRDALDKEIERIRPRMEAAGQDADAAKAFILSAEKRAKPATSDTRFRFEFLSGIREIHADDDGHVEWLELSDNKLTLKEDGRTSARAVGTHRRLDVDSVIYAIGDTVDSTIGLPRDRWGDYAKTESPSYAMNDISFEVMDPATGDSMDRVFVAGWAREASTGLVGEARKDGMLAADAVIQFIEETQPEAASHFDITETLSKLHADVVSAEDVVELEKYEAECAAEYGLNEYKYRTNEQMLKRIQAFERLPACGPELFSPKPSAMAKREEVRVPTGD